MPAPMRQPMTSKPGARPGNQNAAKPPGSKRVMKSYRFRPWIAAWLKAQERQATNKIEQALIRVYGLEPPDASQPVEARQEE